MSSWRMVPLSDVLRPVQDAEVVHPERSYPNLGIFGFGRGVFAKPDISGMDTSAKTLYRVRAGQFIYSRLFAFEGAYAVVPPDLDGCFVSNEFPTFNWIEDSADPGFIAWLFKQSVVWAEIAKLGVGMGDRRRRVHPECLLNFQVPLPPLEEQRRIVARLDAVSARLKARAEASERQEAELAAMLRALAATDTTPTPMREILTPRPLDVVVQREGQYQFSGVYSFGRGVFRGQRKSGADFSYPRLTTLRAGDFTYPKLMAWEGAYGIVPPECDGTVVSPEFPVFVVNVDRVLPDVLAVHFSDPRTWERLSGSSTGTNARRRRLHPDNLLAYEMPVPSPRLQGLLRDVMQRAGEVRALNAANAEDAVALLPAMLHQTFSPAAC
jgi:type I restriction enzyme S subunit